VPEIEKIHQFAAIRIERHLVACYVAEDEARFRLHRDNATKGPAHRRFAVSIDLSEDFDGGEVVFPKYGTRGYRPAAGGAVGFSCSLLYAVTQVTRGRRYVFLPFLYDDAAAQIPEQNTQFVEEP
jgi:predicted 2-oxoglutarate/Fe(II)-dependent dioxygenase YbiX